MTSNFTWECLCGARYTESATLTREGVLALVKGHLIYCPLPGAEARPSPEAISPRGRQ